MTDQPNMPGLLVHASSWSDPDSRTALVGGELLYQEEQGRCWFVRCHLTGPVVGLMHPVASDENR